MVLELAEPNLDKNLICPQQTVAEKFAKGLEKERVGVGHMHLYPYANLKRWCLQKTAYIHTHQKDWQQKQKHVTIAGKDCDSQLICITKSVVSAWTASRLSSSHFDYTNRICQPNHIQVSTIKASRT